MHFERTAQFWSGDILIANQAAIGLEVRCSIITS